MGRAVAICLGATALGVALMLVLPEDLLGEGRLFSLSARHGPGSADAIGIAIVCGGWMWFQRALWLNRAELRPRWLAAWLVIAALAALAGCIAAFRADRDLLAVVAAGIAAAAQFALAALGHCQRARL